MPDANISSASVTKKTPAISWVTIALVGLLVALFALSFALGSGKAEEGEEAFVGADAAVVEMLEEEGVEPWFDPIFEPASGEIESGLFAVQAAIGAGILGFALGNLRGRQAGRREAEAEAAARTAPQAPGQGD